MICLSQLHEKEKKKFASTNSSHMIITAAQILRYKITKQEEIKVSYVRVNVESLTKLKDIICTPRSVDFPAKFRDQMNKTFDLAYRNDRGASALIAGRS
jgi:hypothetical protein